MATSCPVGFDAAALRWQVLATYDRVARDPGGDFHFHRGARYAADYLRYDANKLALLPDSCTTRFAGVGNLPRIGPIHPGEIVLDSSSCHNSILLVEFINLQVKAGVALKDVVVRSAITRAQPIMLTGVAAMLGAHFIFDDPIFNGLPVSLIFGILVSTLLTLVVIPVLYYMAYRNRLGPILQGAST